MLHVIVNKSISMDYILLIMILSPGWTTPNNNNYYYHRNKIDLNGQNAKYPSFIGSFYRLMTFRWFSNLCTSLAVRYSFLFFFTQQQLRAHPMYMLIMTTRSLLHKIVHYDFSIIRWLRVFHLCMSLMEWWAVINILISLYYIKFMLNLLEAVIFITSP